MPPPPWLGTVRGSPPVTAILILLSKSRAMHEINRGRLRNSSGTHMTAELTSAALSSTDKAVHDSALTTENRAGLWFNNTFVGSLLSKAGLEQKLNASTSSNIATNNHAVCASQHQHPNTKTQTTTTPRKSTTTPTPKHNDNGGGGDEDDAPSARGPPPWPSCARETSGSAGGSSPGPSSPAPRGFCRRLCRRRPHP